MTEDKHKQKPSFGYRLGSLLGTVAGAVAGLFSVPKSELDETAKRNKAGKAALKAKSVSKVKSSSKQGEKATLKRAGRKKSR